MKKVPVYKRSRKQGKTFKPPASTERKERQEMYRNKRWRELRIRFLKKNKKCFTCPDDANVVDHIVAHKGSEDLFYKIDNYIPLCTHCHNTITTKFDRYQVQNLKGKMQWIKRQRELYNINSSIMIVDI